MKLIAVLVLLMTISGCEKLSPRNSDVDFEKKLECSKLREKWEDKLSQEAKAKVATGDRYYITLTKVCYSKKLNTCLVYAQHEYIRPYMAGKSNSLFPFQDLYLDIKDALSGTKIVQVEYPSIELKEKSPEQHAKLEREYKEIRDGSNCEI